MQAKLLEHEMENKVAKLRKQKVGNTLILEESQEKLLQANINNNEERKTI
jgi:hypothetical protein